MRSRRLPPGAFRKSFFFAVTTLLLGGALLLLPGFAHAQDGGPPPGGDAGGPPPGPPPGGPPPDAQPQQSSPQTARPAKPQATQPSTQTPGPANSNGPAQDANGDYVLPADNAPAAAPAPGTPATLDAAAQQALAGLKDGGTIRGRVTAGGKDGKGGTPLPGVSVTATNSLTGDKYATVTDVYGNYGLAIPKNGRYVVRAELAAFAAGTKEVLLNATSRQGSADIGMELASRVSQSAGTENAGLSAMGFSGRGTQSLSLNSAAAGALAAGFGNQQEAALPSIGGADSGGDSVAVSGASGSTSAGFNFEQARQGFEDQRALQGTTESRNEGGRGGPGGGNMGFAFGGPGPGGGGRSSFRRFNPNSPHGSIVLAAQNSALNARDFSVNGTEEPQPDYGNLRYGGVYVGPVIPGLLTSTKNFLFLSAFGNHGSTPFDQYGTVPIADERNGYFPTASFPGGIYMPGTNTLYPVVNCPTAGGSCYMLPGVDKVAAAYLQGANPLIPLPNQNADSSGRNYRLLTSTTTNTDTVGARFIRTFGSSGGGGMPLPPWMSNRAGSNAWRQNFNANFNYSHTGSDILTLYPDFRGKEQVHQVSGTLGYTIGKGNWNWNLGASVNRSDTQETNPYTNVNNIAGALGIQGVGQVPFFYGLPSVQFNTISSGNETQANNRVNQVLGLSDNTSWSKGSHNVRFGGDIKRINLDVIGGVNATGAFSYTGFATQACNAVTGSCTGGSDLADFEAGYPQLANVQTGGVSDVQKFYFRANVMDAYVQDTWRMSPSITILAGIRYEYFSPYSEKFDHIANLDPNADFTDVSVVLPHQNGYPRPLVNSDPNNFAPRLGVAWKALKNTVVRTGYGVNYNTAQYGAFIQRLGYQPPFATAVNNSQTTPGFTTENGLTANASSTTCTVTPCITNNYAVDKNYRLGYVQVYNLDIQQTLPKGIVLNVGYNGSKGTALDALLAPNRQLNAGPTTPNAEVFNYEIADGTSSFNALAVRLRKRYQNNLSIGLTYTYSHSIDDASSVGAGSQIVAQDPRNLVADRGNSSFDQRHVAKGDWLYQLPFGPNARYLTNNNWASHALAGIQWSGDFTFSTGTPLNPSFAAAAAEAASGTVGSLRPDRVPGTGIQPPGGVSQLNEWFNTSAFVAPCAGTPPSYTNCHFGDSGRYSIFGPGTTVVDMALSKFVQFGDTKSLEFRFQANNALNIVQYEDVGTTFGNPSFGKVLSARAMRQVVLTARYRF